MPRSRQIARWFARATFAGVLTFGFGFTPKTFAQSDVWLTAPRLALVTMSDRAFCDKMADSFTRLASALGHPPAGAIAAGQRAAKTIGAALNGGQVAAWINPASFDLAPAGGPVLEFMETSQVIAATLGIADPALLIRDIAELRELPRMPKRSHVILVLSRASELTPTRAMAVERFATTRGMSVSALWTGTERTAEIMSEARNVAWLVARTRGTFVDLGRGWCQLDY